MEEFKSNNQYAALESCYTITEAPTS